MSTGKRLHAVTAAGSAALVLLSSGCDYWPSRHEPPANTTISKAVSEMHVLVGLTKEVSGTTILGKHYRPVQDSWKLVACVDFVKAETETLRDCNDSFELYRMDSGGWVLNGTINGRYLWVEIPKSQETKPGS